MPALRSASLLLAPIAACALLLAPAAAAQTVPFVEDFDADEAGWADNVGFLLGWSASGGPDGGAYATGPFDFTGFIEPFPGAGPIVFRGEDDTNASDGHFEGNWQYAGIYEIRAWVRHDAPVSLSWILRIANTFNFPAAAYDAVDPVVPPNTWTQLVFEVDPESPYCTAESFSPSYRCLDAMQSVSHVQLGTDAPAALIDGEIEVTFDIDKVETVPEPALLVQLAAGLGGLVVMERRRRRRGSDSWR